MEQYTDFKEALKRGKRVRKLRDEIMLLTLHHMEAIEDEETLLEIRKQLGGE